MQKLLEGIHQFQTTIFRPQRELFERLAKGQSPDTLFITCADSRINPNLITQTEPGELFILRNAGNLIPPYGTSAGGEVATIEYAVAVLKVKDIIVCGHSHCGAMNALLAPRALQDLPAVSAWLTHAEATRRIIKEKYPDPSGDGDLLTLTAEENVLVQLENLRTHPAVAVGLAKGELKLHAWMYKIPTGEVFAYDPHRQQYVTVEEAGRPLPLPAYASLSASASV
jgi:carbonic anhydrase